MDLRGSSAVPNADFGEVEVKAVVQPRDMAEAGPALAEELLAYCRQHLSALKCPRSIDFEAELPRHPTGKLYDSACCATVISAGPREQDRMKWDRRAMEGTHLFRYVSG